MVINGGTLGLQGFSDTVASLTMSSGSITGTGTLTTTGDANLTGGTVAATLTTGGTTTITNGALALANVGSTLVDTNAAGQVELLSMDVRNRPPAKPQMRQMKRADNSLEAVPVSPHPVASPLLGA